jgi:Fur family ferric uptake transcriptional regulator
MSCATILKQKGFKLTPQRRLILGYIHDNESHVTAEEIIKYVEDRAPGIDKSTVYRTLDLLENTGCVLRSETDGRSIYHHSEEGHHHHLVCRVCGKSIECDEDIFSAIKKNIIKRYDFTADLKHIMISGLCSDCIGTKV